MFLEVLEFVSQVFESFLSEVGALTEALTLCLEITRSWISGEMCLKSEVPFENSSSKLYTVTDLRSYCKAIRPYTVWYGSYK